MCSKIANLTILGLEMRKSQVHPAMQQQVMKIESSRVLFVTVLNGKSSCYPGPCPVFKVCCQLFLTTLAHTRRQAKLQFYVTITLAMISVLVLLKLALAFTLCLQYSALAMLLFLL